MMTDREKDPKRCKELRRIEGEILRQMNQTRDKRDENRRKIDNKRAELSRLRVKKKELDRERLLSIAGAATGVRAGAVLGVSTVNIEIQLELIKQNIERVNDELRLIGNDAQYLLNGHNRLQNSLQENARELASLNCVI